MIIICLLLTSHSQSAFYSQSVNENGLVLLRPTNGEELVLGGDFTIRWQAKIETGNLTIELWKDGYKLGDIAENVSLVKGEYLWKVGTFSGRVTPPGGKYALCIRTSGPEPLVSVRDFSIIPEPPVMSGDQRLAAHVAISPYGVRQRNEKWKEWIKTEKIKIGLIKKRRLFCLDGMQIRSVLKHVGLTETVNLQLEIQAEVYRELGEFAPDPIIEGQSEREISFSTIPDCIKLKPRFGRRILGNTAVFLHISDLKGNTIVKVPIQSIENMDWSVSIS